MVVGGSSFVAISTACGLTAAPLGAGPLPKRDILRATTCGRVYNLYLLKVDLANDQKLERVTSDEFLKVDC